MYGILHIRRHGIAADRYRFELRKKKMEAMLAKIGFFQDKRKSTNIKLHKVFLTRIVSVYVPTILKKKK